MNKPLFLHLLTIILLVTNIAQAQINLPVASEFCPIVVDEIEIDGIATEQSWSDTIPITIVHSINGDYYGESDISGFYRMCYDLDAFYIYFRVTDDIATNWHPEAIAGGWECDGVEVSLNVDTAGVFESGTFADDAVQIRFNRGYDDAADIWQGIGGTKEEGYDIVPLSFATIDHSGYYEVEARIPWGYAMPNGKDASDFIDYAAESIGFDVMLLDSDSGDPDNAGRETMVAWDADEDGDDAENRSWNDVGTFGIIQFEEIPTVPVANAGEDQVVPEQSLVTLDGTGSFDYYNNPISYSWESLHGIVLSDSTLENPSFSTPDIQHTEQYSFVLTVFNSSAYSEPDTVTITSHKVNQLPVAIVGPDQEVNENTEFTLDGSNSYDPDGDQISYLWTTNTGIEISDPTLAMPVIMAPEVSDNYDYPFYLTVFDGSDKSDSVAVVVRIKQVNIAPLADAGADQSVNAGDLVILDGSGSSDFDEDDLNYVWTSLDGVNLAGASTSSAMFNAPDVNQEERFRFVLVVNDGELSSIADTTIVTVYGSEISRVEGNRYAQLVIAPNPVATEFTIDLKNTELQAPFNITLRDINGKVVMHKTFVENLISIDISQLGTKGIYTVQLTDSDQSVFTKNIVIE